MQANKRPEVSLRNMLGLYPVERGLIKQTWREFFFFFGGKSVNSSAEIADLRIEPLKKISARRKSHG